jgi:hypothetical protein
MLLREQAASTWELSIHDLDFDWVPIECLSSTGCAYTRWVRIGMPRIPTNIRDCVFYLYATAEDALAGKNPGGTGFLTARGMHPSVRFLAVTNWHVACRDGFSVIRLQNRDGSPDILEFGPEDWEFVPGKYDIAAVPVSLNPMVHQTRVIHATMFEPQPKRLSDGAHFIGNSSENAHYMGVGDDTFMMGLFVDHAGLGTNVPSARFGNISLIPDKDALIKQPTGYKGLSYVVDMHSRTGFSGSPVFAYRTLGGDLSNPLAGLQFESLDARRSSLMRETGRLKAETKLRLLGIHWGQFPESWELKNLDKIEEARRDHLIIEGAYVTGYSGMTCVIPAWQILEVLDKAIEKHPLTPEQQRSNDAQPVEESVPPANDANPNHQEDFTSLVSLAARKPAQED